MTTETTPSRKARIAKRIAKIVVVNCVSGTVGTLVHQNVSVDKKVAKVQLAIGAYAMSVTAADKCWETIEREINEIAEAFRNAKQAKEDEVVVITDVE